MQPTWLEIAKNSSRGHQAEEKPTLFELPPVLRAPAAACPSNNVMSHTLWWELPAVQHLFLLDARHWLS